MSRDPSAGTSPRLSPRLVVLLGLLAVLGPLTIDLYLPAFPQMQADLATSPTQIQLTLSAATIGFALGQLAVGPWSDSVGRRWPLLLATGVHIAASIGIAAAADIVWILVLRVVQGAGAAGGGVVAMAMIRDVAHGRELIRGLARVALFTGIAPVVAPFLGSQLMAVLDWRGIFVVVASYGMSILVVCLMWLPETLTPALRLDAADRGTVWNGYATLFADRRFVGVALVGGMMVSSVFAYLTGSSFVLQESYGLTPQEYGAVSAGNAVAFVLGTQVSAVVAQRRSPRAVLWAVLPGMAITAFTLSIVGVVSGGLALIIPLVLVFFVLAGACGPSLGALGLAEHGARAGTATALLGATNFGIAGLTAPIVGILGLSDFIALGIVIGVAMTAATCIHGFLVSLPSKAADRTLSKGDHS